MFQISVLQTGQARKLFIWYDRCVGQNKNWRVLNLYANLVHTQLFIKIDQIFLCSGHSFLPCDRDFALIERKKLKTLILGNFKYIIVNK